MENCEDTMNAVLIQSQHSVRFLIILTAVHAALSLSHTCELHLQILCKPVKEVLHTELPLVTLVVDTA